jgi:folate-dependent phosphoribosylglycinamide formyltransferase PurN
MSLRVWLTAGFDRAVPAVALAELLRRDGVGVAGILVVSPYQITRVRQLIRQRGLTVLGPAARRLLGRSAGARGDAAPADPLVAFAKEHGIDERSLSRWARRHGVPYHRVSSLNHPRALAAIRASAADGVLYAGGGILKPAFLEAARGRVLNAHAGPAPEIRGMAACEWALLLGLPPQVTIHFIDQGIDTGPVLARLPLEVEPGDTIARLRSKAVVRGIMGLRREIEALRRPLPHTPPGAGASRQCFVLAPALAELLELRLRCRAPATAGEASH